MTRLQFDKTFSLFSLSEILQKSNSNRKVRKVLERFFCSKNRDLEDFLHNRALTFEKHLRARTYLYIDNETKEVAGYFTITISTLHTNGVSREVVKLLDGYKDDTPSIPCYLIGQLGKSGKYESFKIGKYILHDTITIIDNAQLSLGGRFILLDAINKKQLIEFYKNNAFFPIENDDDLESIKMIRPYFSHKIVSTSPKR